MSLSRRRVVTTLGVLAGVSLVGRGAAEPAVGPRYLLHLSGMT
jgi:hypothetical protein